MKKIFIPILASAALAPTIAAVSCSPKYYELHVDQDEQTLKCLVTNHSFNKHEAYIKFIVDYTQWDSYEFGVDPKGEFKIRAQGGSPTTDYSFSSKKDIQIIVNGEAIREGQISWTDEYNVKIEDPSITDVLRQKVVEVKTKIIYNGTSASNPPLFWFEAY